MSYSHVRYFDDFENVLCDYDLIQLVEFPTWSRIINNVMHESVLDHIYVMDPTIVDYIESTKHNSVLASLTTNPESRNHLVIISSLSSMSVISSSRLGLDSMQKLSSAKFVNWARSNRGRQR